MGWPVLRDQSTFRDPEGRCCAVLEVTASCPTHTGPPALTDNLDMSGPVWNEWMMDLLGALEGKARGKKRGKEIIRRPWSGGT